MLKEEQAKQGVSPSHEVFPEINVPFDSARVSTTQSSSNIVGVNFRVGKKIGEGSFGILYEG